ncbi:MAG: hypothetical protein HOV81_38295 [Kofleriaceae bacterium]|nr:hypothetical protein [Kofleriaceae bacterium]
MRIESSIITSLSELRAIEQQRLVEERSAIERQRQAEADARQAQERARREAEEARVRAEREELMRLEIARAEAEREARLRVEAAEAAERARLQIALDQQRMTEEMELRRVEAAKKRPTWMVAVTAVACMAAVGLTWFAIDRSSRMADAERAKENALALAKQADEEKHEAAKKVGMLEQNLGELDAQVTKAQKALTDAQNDADRKRAAAELVVANQRKWEAKKAADAAKAALDKEIRNTPIDVSKCTGSLGCMPSK